MLLFIKINRLAKVLFKISSQGSFFILFFSIYSTNWLLKKPWVMQFSTESQHKLLYSNKNFFKLIWIWMTTSHIQDSALCSANTNMRELTSVNIFGIFEDFWPWDLSDVTEICSARIRIQNLKKHLKTLKLKTKGIS